MSSSGPAGKKQGNMMGVYRQSGETHDDKPVWSRHQGPEKLYYNGKDRILLISMGSQSQ